MWNYHTPRLGEAPPNCGTGGREDPGQLAEPRQIFHRLKHGKQHMISPGPERSITEVGVVPVVFEQHALLPIVP